MICGNKGAVGDSFVYRTSSHLTQFFSDIDMDYCHYGSTRKWWVKERLQEILNDPQPDEQTLPEGFLKVISRLMEIEDATQDDQNRQQALTQLNLTLSREGFEAFYAD